MIGLTTISLVIAIGFAAWWVRSLGVADFVGRYDGKGGAMGISSARGKIAVYSHFWPPKASIKGFYFECGRPAVWGNGDRWFAYYPQRKMNGFTVVFPHAIGCIFAAPAVVLMLRRRKSARRGFDVVMQEVR